MIKRSGAIQSPDKTLLKLFNHGISNVQSKNILCNFIKVNQSSIGIKVNKCNYIFKKIYKGKRLDIQRKTRDFIFSKINQLI